MPCRFASSGTVATSRSASRAILALNVASNFLRDLVISVLHRLRQSRTLHTLTFGPISGVHFSQPPAGGCDFLSTSRKTAVRQIAGRNGPNSEKTGGTHATQPHKPSRKRRIDHPPRTQSPAPFPATRPVAGHAAIRCRADRGAPDVGSVF